MVEMWKEALFSATAFLYAENEAMWNKNLIFGGAISWIQAITLCPGNAMTHNMAGMLGVLEGVCGDSSISSVSPATDRTSHTHTHTHTHNAGKFTKASRDTFLGESTAVMLLHQKWVIFECGGEWSQVRASHWKRCLWYQLLFPHCRGDVLLWEHWCVTCVLGLCYARMCILTRYPLLRLAGLSLSIWSVVGVTCFKMSSQFSHFINTKKTQQHQLTALFWELMPCLWKQSGTAP